MSLIKLAASAALAATLFLSTGIPASAASVTVSPGFGFGIQIGEPTPEVSCLSTNKITRNLRSQGYRNISLVDEDDDVLIFIARKGSRYYELEVDGCDGDILSRTRVTVR